MERTGILSKAGMEEAKSGKEVFKVAIDCDDEKDPWVYTLFDPDLIGTAKSLKGQTATLKLSKDGNFWKVDDILEAPHREAPPLKESPVRASKTGAMSYEEFQLQLETVKQEGYDRRKAVEEVNKAWMADKVKDDDVTVKMMLLWQANAMKPPGLRPEATQKLQEVATTDARKATFQQLMKQMGHTTVGKVRGWLDQNEFGVTEWSELIEAGQNRAIEVAREQVEALSKKGMPDGMPF